MWSFRASCLSWDTTRIVARNEGWTIQRLPLKWGYSTKNRMSAIFCMAFWGYILALHSLPRSRFQNYATCIMLILQFLVTKSGARKTRKTTHGGVTPQVLKHENTYASFTEHQRQRQQSPTAHDILADEIVAAMMSSASPPDSVATNNLNLVDPTLALGKTVWLVCYLTCREVWKVSF